MQLNKLFPIITTDKLDEVRAFYTQHLGFKVSIDHPGGYLGLRSIQNADLEMSFAAPCDQTQPYNGHGATLCLAFMAPRWILAGGCELRHDFRNFRLDRIQALDVLPETFPDEPGKTLNDFLALVSG